MQHVLILASQSKTRLELIRNAGVSVKVVPARVDEAAIKDALISEDAPPKDIADQLADAKARKIALKMPGLVLGCDQILSLSGEIFSKPDTAQDAVGQLKRLRGQVHDLYSAAVLYQDAEPVWRHVGHATLHMRLSSDAYLREYVERNWSSIQNSVGSYRIEGEGTRLFQRIDGDFFNILGLPLIELLTFLIERGSIPS
jgi:septum formation protein